MRKQRDLGRGFRRWEIYTLLVVLTIFGLCAFLAIVYAVKPWQ